MITQEQVKCLEELYDRLEDNDEWVSIFNHVRSTAQQYEFTDKVARQMANQALNRYLDVNPFDHSRVKLEQRPCSISSCSLYPPTDYINASLVSVSASGRRYILAQGPLPNTCSHFWLMVWQQQCSAIVMLNRVVEKNQLKCHQYWPLKSSAAGDTSQCSLLMEDVSLMVENTGTSNHANFTVTNIKLTDCVSGENRQLIHYHYTSWPDFGVPSSAEAFLTFLQAVRTSDCLEEHRGPAVVHCSAGIGRSGTFCLVDSFLLMLEGGCEVQADSISSLLLSMRRYRVGLIQTAAQLSFSYMAIVQGARSLLQRGTLCDQSNGVVSHSDAEGNCLASPDRSLLSSSPPPPLPKRLNSLPGQRDKSDCQTEDRASNRSSTTPSSSTSDHPPSPPSPACPPVDDQQQATIMSDVNQGDLWQRRSRKQQLQQRLAEIRARQLRHELMLRRRQQLKPLLYTAAAVGVAVLSYLLVNKWTS